MPQAAEIAAQHEELLPDEELTTLPLPEHSEVAAEGPEPALELPQAALPEPSAREPEFELDQDFELVIEPEPVVPAHEMLAQVPTLPKKSATSCRRNRQETSSRGRAVEWKHFTSEDFLSDLGKEIDQLGLGELTPPIPVQPEPAAPAAKQGRIGHGARRTKR